MGTFDRNRFKATPIATLQGVQKNAEAKVKYFGQNQRATFLQVEDGDNVFRIMPPIDNEGSPYLPIRTSMLPCEVDKYEDGEVVGKEVKNKKVFIATTHSSVVKKDPIEVYIDYVYRLAEEQFQDKKDKEKFLNPINGYRANGKWIGGIKPTSGYICYAKKDGNFGRLELKPSWFKEMQKISSQMTEDETISYDVFSDPDDGYPLIISKGKSEKGDKTEYSLRAKQPTRKQSWEDFLESCRLTDDELLDLSKQDSLTSLFKDVYSQRDFDLAVDGLKRFDEKNGYNIFSDDSFLTELQEIAKVVPEKKTKEEEEIEGYFNNEKPTTDEKKPVQNIDEEEEDDEEDDEYDMISLMKLDRAGLKKLIKQNEYPISVVKSMTDEQIANAIYEYLNPSDKVEVEEDDDDFTATLNQEDDDESPLDKIRKKRASMGK